MPKTHWKPKYYGGVQKYIQKQKFWVTKEKERKKERENLTPPTRLEYEGCIS